MKKLNQKGFGLVEGLLIFVVVGLIAGAGYYVYNRSQNNNQKAQNNPVAEQQKTESNKPQEISYSDRVIFKGSENTEVRNLGDRVKAFYELALEEQDAIKPCENEENHEPNDVCKVQKPYLTQKAIDQLKAPREYALLSCGQMKIFIFSIDEPKISGDSATTGIRHLQFGQPLQEATIGSLSLLKTNDTWRIDSFTCNL